MQIESHLTPKGNRSKVIEANQIMDNGQIDPTKIERALNDWLVCVEDQVNTVEEMV